MFIDKIIEKFIFLISVKEQQTVPSGNEWSQYYKNPINWVYIFGTFSHLPYITQYIILWIDTNKAKWIYRIASYLSSAIDFF